ncbi:MAG: peptidylprolyl isomerase [Planctomycetes bacterium]|nr:peptidylprolyl isomerase [Planctomycetota bacterium]MCA8936426.1 peptidylprolyl isomerase [Planctomycetota bacterium]
MNFRVDYTFQLAALEVRKGDSAAAVKVFEALLKDERKNLDTRQFNQIQQSLQFQRQAVEQWEDELKFQAEDAEKTNPRLVIETDKGKIVVELFEDDAPNTTAALVKLAKDEFYDGLNFHRVEPNFVAQGGCPNGDGTGSPGWRLKSEISRRNHFRGSFAMARSQRMDSQGCQFYICVSNNESVLSLSGKYVVAGRVIEGMEVADQLRVGDKIKSVRAENLRDHEYKPVTLPE